MSAEQKQSFMQRKARTGREEYAARAMSMGRALRLTAARQAEQMMELAVGVIGLTRRKLTSEELNRTLDAPWMTMLMDGPGTRVAAVMMEPVLVTALIQQQTMGKIVPPSATPEDRTHTATDAALCAPFIEALLSKASLMPEEERDRELLANYRFGVLAEEPRHAQLALDGAACDMIELNLDLAAGTLTGHLRLILPEPARVRDLAHADLGNEENVLPSEHNLAENVLGLRADLTVALTRIVLPMKRITGFEVGEVVALNVSGMSEALVLDGNGTPLSRGTLGQIDGMRALQVQQQGAKRITEPRRRASDRGELDLPDVTGGNPGRRAEDAAAPAMDLGGADDVVLPSMSDVDIFGNMDDLPDLPDLEEAAQAADDQMAPWQNDLEVEEDADAPAARQAGW